jgi:hypothetical protein
VTCLQQSVAVGDPAVCDRVQGSPQSYMYEMMQSLVRLGAPAATNPSTACCLLSQRVCWGRGGAVHCALVKGGRQSACSNALHKSAEGCSDSSDKKVLSGFGISVIFLIRILQKSIKNALLS